MAPRLQDRQRLPRQCLRGGLAACVPICTTGGDACSASLLTCGAEACVAAESVDSATQRPMTVLHAAGRAQWRHAAQHAATSSAFPHTRARRKTLLHTRLASREHAGLRAGLWRAARRRLAALRVPKRTLPPDLRHSAGMRRSPSRCAVHAVHCGCSASGLVRFSGTWLRRRAFATAQAHSTSCIHFCTCYALMMCIT